MRLHHLSVIGFLALVPASAFASFSDVPATHPNYDAINYVQQEGIVEGYADGTYKPDATINRAEFAKILEESIPDAPNGVGLCPMVSEDFTGFSDVHDEWFWMYVCMQKGRGIIGGYPDKTFRPSANINFVEAAKMLYGANHLDDRGILVEKPTATKPWFQVYVQYLEQRRAIPLSIASLDQQITRGEMAEMVYRLKAQKIDKPSRTYDELVQASALAQYKDKKYNFSVEYPADWQAEASVGSNNDFGNYTVSFTVPSEQFSPLISVFENMTVGMAEKNIIADHSDGHSKVITVGGYVGREVTYEEDSGFGINRILIPFGTGILEFISPDPTSDVWLQVIASLRL
ncbi:MAG: secreted protein [Candidatus Peribacteria bacterium]|nr:secreted protein [Candidatus Peribacteria bacterium]